MILIHFGGKHLQFPSKLDELNRKQLSELLRIFSDDVPERQQEVYFLFYLLREFNPWIKWWFFLNVYLLPFLEKITFSKINFGIQEIDPEDLCDLADLARNLIKSKKPIEKNPAPVLCFGATRLKGPESQLANICYRQYRKMEENIVAFDRTQDEKYINMVLAWLYLPATSVIERFKIGYLTRNSALARAQLISRLPLEDRQVIYSFVLSARENIVKKFPHVYPQNEDAPAKKLNPIQLREDFEAILRTISGSVLTDERADLMNVYDFLAHLNDKVYRYILEQEAFQNAK